MSAVAWCTPAPVVAQAIDSTHTGRVPEAFVHESWTVQQGLPVNSINALLQSRDGYLWVATFDGLVRFDGVRFTIFDSGNSPGLPSNRILDLLETRDGSLWMRTDQLRLIRFRDGVFTHWGSASGLRHAVRTIHEDGNGTVWVGTDGGLGVIREDRFVAIAPDVIRGPVSALTGGDRGPVWAGSTSGALFRVTNGRAVPVATESPLASEWISALFLDARGTLWIGTHAGIWRYHDAAERIATTPPVAGFRASSVTGDVWILTSSAVFRHDGGDLVHVSDRVDVRFVSQRLIPDHAGRILYSSGPELHREGVHIHTLPALRDGQHSERERITSVVLDHEGSIWLGTVGAGLHRLKPSLFTVYSEPEGLSSKNVHSVYEDRNGTIWVGTLNKGTNRLVRGRIEPLSIEDGDPPNGRSFLHDRAGRLWIGGGRPYGVRVCTPPIMRCTRTDPDVIGAQNVLAIHEDTSGALWFGTDDGLFRSDDADWTRFDAADGAPAFPVRAIRHTGDGAVWMGTNGGGLIRYQNGEFIHITTSDGLPINSIRSLHADADGLLWVGTEGRGLARLDPRDWTDGRRGGRIVHYGTDDGLFDDIIHVILDDGFGRLWMSSNRGIFRVDRRELLDFAAGRVARIHSTAYTERDGLRNREANGGSQPAGIRASDGRLWFATQDGVAVVDPARLGRNLAPPQVVIERVSAGGALMRTSDRVLELDVEQRDLEIEYTALSFVAPANVRFRFRLEPYDTDWVDAGNRRTAYYTQVPPGHYTFRVLASNDDGVWNEDGASLTLRLAPRFYETRSFRVLSLLAIAALVSGAVLWRMRQLQVRTRELARLVDDRTRELRTHQQQLERQTEQLQELDHAKSRFFANISHEFRTPLTLILGPLRDMIDRRRNTQADAAPHQLDMMMRNAQRLLRLVNQVLDLARLEGGALALEREPGDIVELARSAARSFTPLAERRGIAITFHAEPDRLLVELDAEQMEKVLLNLLSNAFKFTEPGGAVAVTVGRDAGSAVVEVRDTGIGIAPDHLPHVFERFYQADASATRGHEGTGIGLSLASELVDLHGGSIAVSSLPGEGSTFTVRLPLLVDSTSERAAHAGSASSTAAATHAPDNEWRGPGVQAVFAGAGKAPMATAPLEEEAADTAVVEPDREDRTTVLVIDDNTDIRIYVRSVLEPGFRVIEATDGEQGLERARERLPDLIIADVMMPRLDGFAMTRALRDDPLTDCIPTILLTARTEASDEMRGLGTGADDYIAKPFHAGVLEARVRTLIASRRRLRERFREEGIPTPASSPAAPRSDLEMRLRSIVEENLTEPDFSPNALAAAAGLSYLQLYRRLADEMDATPSRFIRTVRVERAADLIRDGAGSITEVAYSVGFNSLSYFNRCFRERFDIAPSAVTQSVT